MYSLSQIVALLPGTGLVSAQDTLPLVRIGRPVVRLGASPTASEEALLAGVVGATRLPSGGIAVGEGTAPRIVLFTAQGQVQRVVGQKGDGPGELRMPRWVGRCGPGEVGAYDAAQSRLTVFSATGTLRETRPVAAVAGYNQLVACLPGSLFFLLARSGVATITPGTTGLVNAVLVRLRERSVDTIGSPISGKEFYVNSARSSFSEVPLGRQVVATGGPTRLFVCTNHDGRCVVFDTAGIRRATFTVALARRRLSSGDWATARQRMVDQEPLPDVRARKAQLLREFSQPEFFPRIDRIVADAADRLWIRTFREYRKEWSDWLILDPTGHPLARVALPERLQVIELGTDYVLGLARDSEGVWKRWRSTGSNCEPEAAEASVQFAAKAGSPHKSRCNNELRCAT